MTHRVERKKWILYRHTNDFGLITTVALQLKAYSKSSLSKENRKELLLRLKELKYYKERNTELPLDSINHRINTLAYYMFGYKDDSEGEERFLFSPLGNLFLKHVGTPKNITKIFLTMLWGLQFEHPHGGSDKIFNLYPFRLIFKLLLDERIDKKLFAYEFTYLIPFIETINEDSYESLVGKILTIRAWSNAQIETEFKKDEHTMVNAAYEWDYYVSELLKNAGILNKDTGEVICQLQQGKDTFRKITRNSVSLSEELVSYCNKLLAEHPYDEEPLRLDDPERLKVDVIKEIYNFYPLALLGEVGEEQDEQKYELLNLAKLIEKYSNNTDGEEAYLFENILTEGFNMFVDVEAKKIGGADNTDIECLYITQKKKFAVDAKSTKAKLSGLNAGRLARHREKVGGQYTIVITPRYVPAVLHDIKATPIVIIRASTFSEYLYNHINNEIREISYADFDEIITSNLGSDISNIISKLTIDKFAVSEINND